MKKAILFLLLITTILVSGCVKEESRESKFSHLIIGKVINGDIVTIDNASVSYEIDNQFISDGLYIRCGIFEFYGPCGVREITMATLYGDINNKSYKNFTIQLYAKKDRDDYNISLKIGRCNDKRLGDFICYNVDNERIFNLTSNFQWYEANLPTRNDSQPAIYLQLVDNLPSSASGDFYGYVDKVIILKDS